jgi:hypothetical protein
MKLEKRIMGSYARLQRMISQQYEMKYSLYEFSLELRRYQRLNLRYVKAKGADFNPVRQAGL